METAVNNTIIKKYSSYKDSGVEWLGEIPEHWEVKRLKFFGFVFPGLSGKKGEDFSREFSYGMKPYVPFTNICNNVKIDENEYHFVKIDIGENQNSLRRNDLLFLMSSETSEDIAKCSIYLGNKEEVFLNSFCKGFRLTNSILNPEFVNLLFQSSKYRNYFSTAGKGFTRINLKQEYINNVFCLIPPLPEQKAIAEFLDQKTALIDQAIRIKQKQIELLKERRQILIHHAVTRGLDPTVKLKDSGVEWIGMIPEGWEVKRLKYVLEERNERSIEGFEPLLMMSQKHGLVIRSEYHDKAEVAQSNEGNKIVRINDLVFNKLKAHLGVFFKSEIPFKGLVSPDYAVYYSKGVIDDMKYLELLFRNPEYIGEFICRATGIVEGLIRLYTHDLFDIAIPVPPTSEQQAILLHISDYSNKIMTSISLKEKEIEKLKEYKATLINSAVTGKIKVTGV